MLLEAREMLAEVLSAKFSGIPEHIMKRISTTEDRSFLNTIAEKGCFKPVN